MIAEEKHSLRHWAMGIFFLSGTLDLGRPLFACFWLHFPAPTRFLQLHLGGDEVNRAWELSQGKNNWGGEGTAFLKLPPGLFDDTTAQRAAPAQHNPTAPSQRCHQK